MADSLKTLRDKCAGLSPDVSLVSFRLPNDKTFGKLHQLTAYVLAANNTRSWSTRTQDYGIQKQRFLMSIPAVWDQVHKQVLIGGPVYVRWHDGVPVIRTRETGHPIGTVCDVFGSRTATYERFQREIDVGLQMLRAYQKTSPRMTRIVAPQFKTRIPPTGTLTLRPGTKPTQAFHKVVGAHRREVEQKGAWTIACIEDLQAFRRGYAVTTAKDVVIVTSDDGMKRTVEDPFEDVEKMIQRIFGRAVRVDLAPVCPIGQRRGVVEGAALWRPEDPRVAELEFFSALTTYSVHPQAGEFLDYKVVVGREEPWVLLPEERQLQVLEAKPWALTLDGADCKIDLWNPSRKIEFYRMREAKFEEARSRKAGAATVPMASTTLSGPLQEALAKIEKNEAVAGAVNEVAAEAEAELSSVAAAASQEDPAPAPAPMPVEEIEKNETPAPDAPLPEAKPKKRAPRKKKKAD